MCCRSCIISVAGACGWMTAASCAPPTSAATISNVWIQRRETCIACWRSDGGCSARSLAVQPAALRGISHDVHAGLGAELLHRPGLIGLHGLDADIQRG